MSYQNNDLNPDRNLVDVFKELQQKRAEDGYNYQSGNPRGNQSSGITTYFTSNKHKKIFARTTIFCLAQPKKTNA